MTTRSVLAILCESDSVRAAMKYRVTIEGREREVDVTLTPQGGASVKLDGTPIEADVERVPGGISLRLGARIYDIAIGGKAEAMQVSAGGARTVAEVISARAQARAKRKGDTGTGANELRAPMPGRVVKVLVAAGADVKVGDPCIVIEAMKMENELRAPKEGKIAAVHVNEGVSVESQALLVTFE